MKYEELDDAQKEKARDWYREASVHDDWYDFVYEDAIRIAQGLQGVQKKYFYRLLARCQHRGHYYHSGCMRVEVEHRDDSYRDVNDAEAEVTQLLRDFADWIYGRLEAEYDYLNSDEQVEESILANEYDFDTGNGGIRI